MNYSFLDDGYEIVRGAISKEIADLSYEYFKLKSKCVSYYYTNKHLDKEKDTWYWGGFGDNQVPSKNTYFTYGDFLFDTIMLKLHNLMEEKTNSYLLPTFSFARIYKKGNELKKHKDAEIAEISSTMNLGGDMYPIFITDPNKNEPIKIELNPGDMLIYKGDELEHFREPFKGEECGQVHFHFVKANKDNLKYLFDGRPHMGLSANTNILNKTSNQKNIKENNSNKLFEDCYKEGMGTEQMAPLLYSLIRFTRPKNVLEVGLGYTTPWLAKGLEDNKEVHIDGNTDTDYLKKPYNPKLICIDNMSDEKSTASKAALAVSEKPFVNIIKSNYQGLAKDIKDKYGDLDFVWFDCGNYEDYEKFLKEYLPICSGYLALHFTYFKGEPNLNYKVIEYHCKGWERVDIIEPHKYRQGSFALLRKTS